MLLLNSLYYSTSYYLNRDLILWQALGVIIFTHTCLFHPCSLTVDVILIVFNDVQLYSKSSCVDGALQGLDLLGVSLGGTRCAEFGGGWST